MKKVLGGPDQRKAFRGKSWQLAVMALLLCSTTAFGQGYNAFDYNIRRALNEHFYSRWNLYTADDTSQVRQSIKAYGYTWNRGEFLYSFRPPQDTLRLKQADTGSIVVKGHVIYEWTQKSGVLRWDSISAAGSEGGGSGTVTNFSAGDLSPLFTTSETNTTTTPSLSFTLSNPSAYTIFGNNTGSSAAPAYFSPVLASNLFQNQGTTTTVLTGNASGAPSWAAVNLATMVNGNLSVNNLNGGTGASGSTFWAGDGTWKAVTGEANTASNLGSGLGLFTTKSGVNLPFKSLTFPGSISGTSNTNDIALQLDGDQLSPSDNTYYGKFGGNKGWHSIAPIVVSNAGTGLRMGFVRNDSLFFKTLKCISGCTLATNATDSTAELTVTGGGSATLAGLTDVNISSPANLQILQYQTSDNKWHNVASNDWSLDGNATGVTTKKLGTTDLNHVDFIANNSPIGRIHATGGFSFGGTGLASGFKFQSGYRALFFSTPTGSNELLIDDDGVNGTRFTLGVNASGTNNRVFGLMTLNHNAMEVMQYGTSNVLFSIGANAGSTNPGAPLTHSYTDASTSGKKYGYAAINTFNPTSGTASRDAFIDSTTVNQTGGANGKYGSFHSILIKTACADCHGVWIENSDSWFGSTSGRVAIGLARSTAPTAFLHLAASTTSAASLRIPTGTAPSSPNEGDLWSASNFAKYYNGSATRRFALHNDASPSNGQLPIGNGTDFTLANITSSDGSVTVTNGSGSISLTLPVVVESSSYTATLTNNTNISSSTFDAARYQRIGSVVEVSVRVKIDPTATGLTVLYISLPISSNITTVNDVIGVGTCEGFPDQNGVIYGDVSGDRAGFSFTASSTAEQTFYLKFSYMIIVE